MTSPPEPVASEGAAKVATSTENRPAKQSPAKPSSKISLKSSATPLAKPSTKPISPISKPTSKPASKSTAKPSSKPSTQLSKPSVKPSSKSPIKPVTQRTPDASAEEAVPVASGANLTSSTIATTTPSREKGTTEPLKIAKENAATAAVITPVQPPQQPRLEQQQRGAPKPLTPPTPKATPVRTPPKAVSIAPKKPNPNPNTAPTSPGLINESRLDLLAVAENDVVFVDGQAFNGRGYPVCGVANQRGRRCGRIGTCPFHKSKKQSVNATATRLTSSDGKKPTAKRPRTALASASTQQLPGAETEAPLTTPPNDPAGTNGAAAMALSAALTSSAAVTPSTSLAGTSTTGKRASGRSSQSAIRRVAIPPQKSRFKRSWTTEEHRLFLQAMRIYGKGKWKEIAAQVKTRTANQCQSHAQKYFLRQAKSNSERKKKSIHDVTDVEMSKMDPTPLLSNQPQPPVPTTGTASTAAAAAAAAAVSLESASGVNGAAGKEVVLLSRKPTAVPLAPAPLPNGTPVSLAHNFGSLQHRLTPVSMAATAAMTCAARAGAAVAQDGSGAATVPVVFPMSNLNGMQYAPMVQPYLSAGNAAGAAVVAPPPPAKLRVTVHVNGKVKGGMALVLPDSLKEFFELAKSKLDFHGSFGRVFTRSGGEITCLDEMVQDDMLWLSSGGDFLTPR